eukprot:SAG11_NODE_19250_length_471_cov_0.432796_1_plen_65_part_10
MLSADGEEKPWAYWSYCGGVGWCPPYPRYEPPTETAERFLLFETRGAVRATLLCPPLVASSCGWR